MAVVAAMPSGNGACSMVARRVGSAWEVLAPAKLNLYLNVLGRRPDGFHELETLMAPIQLYDHLRWDPTAPVDEPQFSLGYDPSTPASYQAAAPADDRNLVVRAIRALANFAGIAPFGRITLLKRIPAQAGMGGGSSDAAAALVLANSAWNLNLPHHRLASLAAELGSDVPFFLAGRSAVCRGRGEQVEPVIDMPPVHVVVLKPPVGVATEAAYGALAAGPCSEAAAADSSRRLSALLLDLRRGELAGAGRRMTNRLQSAAVGLCRQLEEIGAVFDKLSCYGRQMTGSGSAWFGVMRSAQHARWAAGVLTSRSLGTVWATSTRR